MPLILELSGFLSVQGQPGLCMELQNSQDYTVSTNKYICASMKELEESSVITAPFYRRENGEIRGWINF